MTSSISKNPDLNRELEDELQYYVDRILAIKRVKKMLDARLLLAETSSTKNTPSLPQASITHLEISLLESMHNLRKFVSKYRIQSVAVQKSIQSMLLNKTPRNLFNMNGNYVELLVGENLRSILNNSKVMAGLKKKHDEQANSFRQSQKMVLGRIRSLQYQFNHRDGSNKNRRLIQEKKLSDLRTKINYINRLSCLIVSFITGCYTDQESRKVLIELSLKWRNVRSIEYYQNIVSDK